MLESIKSNDEIKQEKLQKYIVLARKIACTYVRYTSSMYDDLVSAACFILDKEVEKYDRNKMHEQKYISYKIHQAIIDELRKLGKQNNNISRRDGFILHYLQKKDFSTTKKELCEKLSVALEERGMPSKISYNEIQQIEEKTSLVSVETMEEEGIEFPCSDFNNFSPELIQILQIIAATIQLVIKEEPNYRQAYNYIYQYESSQQFTPMEVIADRMNLSVTRLSQIVADFSKRVCLLVSPYLEKVPFDIQCDDIRFFLEHHVENPNKTLLQHAPPPQKYIIPDSPQEENLEYDEKVLQKVLKIEKRLRKKHKRLRTFMKNHVSNISRLKNEGEWIPVKHSGLIEDLWKLHSKLIRQVCPRNEFQFSSQAIAAFLYPKQYFLMYSNKR